MSNNYTAMKAQEYRDSIQPFLNKMLVTDAICSMRFESSLTRGYRFNNPYVSDIKVQDYVANTDLDRPGNTGYNEYLEITESKGAIFTVDEMEDAVLKARKEAEMIYQMSFQLKNHIDQSALNEAVSAAQTTVAGGTLTSANIFQKLTEVKTGLSRKNGADGEIIVVVDPERTALIAQYFASTGNNVMDSMLKNGKIGSIYGYTFYESNNLPSSATLSMATNPTNGDTISLLGETYTFVTSGTASNPGDISLGASAAATQANVVLALTRTGTEGASTYIALSQDDDTNASNARLSITAFSSDVATVSANDRLDVAETFTAGGNVFGTETTQMLVMRKGAVDCVRLIAPNVTPRDEQRNLGTNYIATTLYGVKAFTKMSNRIGVLTCNA